MEILVENRTKYTEEMFIDLQRKEWLKEKKKVKRLCLILMFIYVGFGIFSLLLRQIGFACFFFAASAIMFLFLNKGYIRTAKIAFKQLEKTLPKGGYHYLFFENYLEMRGDKEAIIKKIPYHTITNFSQTKYSYNFFVGEAFFMVSLDGFQKGTVEKMMKITGKI